MKNLALFTFVLLLYQITVYSQPCLPEGIIFNTQEQIDNFQINYPNCTEIEGDVEIYGNEITSLNGLGILTSIWGNLRFGHMWLGTNALTNLTGLDNLTSIGGMLFIRNLDTLTNLSGLNNVTSIGGDLVIADNTALTSLTGLENLTYAGGLIIGWMGWWGGGNPALSSLTGLNNLTSIGGDLTIYDNDALTSLTGLENLISMGGDLEIRNNESLTSLTGLDNIDGEMIIDLHINHNGSLSICESTWLCNYLTNPNGSVNVYNNASGCNNPPEVAETCGISLPCLPYGNYYFYSQDEIDGFQSDYLNCTELEGFVIINGNNITNLIGLSVVISIGGDLTIKDNNALTGLSGLDNLISIEGDLTIQNNDALNSLTVLDNLISIGGGLTIHYNDALNSLTGLENVTFIEGRLRIYDNDELTTLTGLDNVTSIGGDLEITENDALTSLSELEGLTNIGGGLKIAVNNALTSLTGLEGMTSIGEILWIQGNDALASFAGLDNVTSIGGDLNIFWTNNLTNMSGLESLTTIGGDLKIFQNYALTSLTGLEGLTSIEERLYITGNDTLTSLSGLDNIDATSIGNLSIYGNDLLSTCAVQSVCDYLASPGGYISIHDNAPGCNSQQEVEEACLVSVKEKWFEENMMISPNPLESNTIIEYTVHQNSPVTLKILDLSGREIVTLVNEFQMQGEQILEFNGAGLKPGIYFCVLKTSKGIQTTKMIKL